ncbi:MAG: 4Fe-4S dicluster domain-containing protein [Treponemataceae bacterium]|nr:4Fe-4S dicluster domain-containing protein [Treponemataceae bacterium]
MSITIKKKIIIPDTSFSEAVDAYMPLYDFVPLKDAEGNLSVQKTAVNSRVTEGQVLGKFDAYSASVHAPVPGVLTEYKTLPMPDGKLSEVAVIKLEGEFTFKGKKLRSRSWDSLSSVDLCSILAENGVINTFDTPQSLAREILELNNDYNSRPALSVRLFDADPSICTDSFITVKKTQEILEGVEVIAKAMSAEKIFIFHDKSIKIPAQIPHDKMVFIVVPESKQLMCGKREIDILLENNKYEYKTSIAIDSSTAFAAYEAVVLQKPLLERFVQVSGTSLKKNIMFKVRIGTPIRKLVEQCDGFKKKPYKIIINGLIKGTAIRDPDTPVTSIVKSITILSKKSVPDQEQTHCIHCGNCHRACPVKLHPDAFFDYYYYHTELPEPFLKTSLLCTQCGLCNTSCPARLPLFQSIAIVRGNLK